MYRLQQCHQGFGLLCSPWLFFLGLINSCLQGNWHHSRTHPHPKTDGSRVQLCFLSHCFQEGNLFPSSVAAFSARTKPWPAGRPSLPLKSPHPEPSSLTPVPSLLHVCTLYSIPCCRMFLPKTEIWSGHSTLSDCCCLPFRHWRKSPPSQVTLPSPSPITLPSTYMVSALHGVGQAQSCW